MAHLGMRAKVVNFNVLKVGRRLKCTVIPVQLLAPPVNLGIVVTDRANVAFEVGKVCKQPRPHAKNQLSNLSKD